MYNTIIILIRRCKTKLLISHEVFERGTDFSSIYREREADDLEGGRTSAGRGVWEEDQKTGYLLNETKLGLSLAPS